MNNSSYKRIAPSALAILAGALLFAAPAFAASVREIAFFSQGVSIPQFAGNVIRAVLGIVGAGALASVTYGGFLWMTSAGRADKVEKGRKIFTWSFFGLLVIFGSYGLTAAIFEPAANLDLSTGDASFGPQNGCEERGANWSCINSFCNADQPLNEYTQCVATFNQTNSDLFVNCVPGGPLCGSSTELCCQRR